MFPNKTRATLVDMGVQQHETLATRRHTPVHKINMLVLCLFFHTAGLKQT
jgi:hypothetical protein